MSSSVITPEILEEIVEEIIGEITDIRHQLHKMPEIMFKEYKTSGFIRDYLKKLDIEILDNYLDTDTVAVIRGGNPGKTILLRADIDALPVDEDTGVSYCSESQGMAHSCGHDGHIAVLLGTAKILASLKEQLNCNVKLVFQPAEEEGGGGRILTEKGLLSDDPSVDEVYALHGWPEVEEGHIESCAGPLMAAVDNFDIEITGRGGHAAMPHLSVDPVVMASQAVLAFQNIPSRYLDPVDRTVLSICSVHGGGQYNIIPDTVKIKGTVRYFRKELKNEIKGMMEKILKGITDSAGGDFRLEYHPGYIPLINNSRCVDFLGGTVEKYLGKEYWHSDALITFGAEDFSFYTDKKPGAFFRLGLGKNYPSLHNCRFDFNDRVIKNGIMMMCALALESR